MLKQWLVGACAAASLSVSVPAHADNLWDNPRTSRAAVQWEYGYLGLSAIDAAQTIECLKRDACEESNPIFGKHPKTVTIIAVKALMGAAHFELFKHIYDRDSRAALRFAQLSVVTQGTVVGLNARFAFQ